MKILLVNKFLYPKGGAETYTLRLGEYLKFAGHEVQYFGMYDDKNTVFNSAGKYTKNMDFHSSGAERFLYPLRIIYSFDAKKKIGRVIEDFMPDIIHMNNINFQLTPSIIDEAAKRKVPVVQTVHDLQMLCPNHLMFSGKTKSPCEKCLNGSKLNCVRGRCIHGSLLKSIIGTLEAWLYTIKKTYLKVDRFICPSSFIEGKLLERKRFGRHIYRGRTTAVHNFMEMPLAGECEKGDYVLYFGRLSEEKGINMLAEVCRMLPDIKFIIAGTGPDEHAFDDIKNAEFVGFKTGEELSRLIAGARFSVYPSVWYENCPLSVLESEALGTPVICTALGGLPELVEDGVTGRIIKSVTKDALADAVRELYYDEELCGRMSANCKNKRTEMMTLKKYGEIIENIYADVLKLN